MRITCNCTVCTYLKRPLFVLNLTINCVVTLTGKNSLAEGRVNEHYCRLIAASGKMLTLEELNNPELCLPLRQYKSVISYISSKSINYYRKEFLTELSYATTVHTAQGLTLHHTFSTPRLSSRPKFCTANSRIWRSDQLFLTYIEVSIIVSKDCQNLWSCMVKSDIPLPTVVFWVRKRVPFVCYQKTKFVLSKCNLRPANLPWRWRTRGTGGFHWSAWL